MFEVIRYKAHLVLCSRTLIGLLVASLIASACASIFAERAYALIASAGHGTLIGPMSALRSEKVGGRDGEGEAGYRVGSVWIDFWNIVRRSHTLRLLFLEALCHQLVGNMLNTAFHEALRSGAAYASDNAARAALVILALSYWSSN